MNYVTKATELADAVQKLCDDLQSIQHSVWNHCKERGSYYDFKIGKKYIKVINYDDANGSGASVWGFINVGNNKFKVGDVLKASGWSAPTLNTARGNILEGYKLTERMQYGPGYCSGAIAGTKRNGSFV